MSGYDNLISEDEFDRYRPTLRKLYDANLSSEQIFDIISKEFGGRKPNVRQWCLISDKGGFPANRRGGSKDNSMEMSGAHPLEPVKMGYPMGNQYSATINGGFVVQGDVHGTINASSVQLKDSTINIGVLVEHLKTTTQQCSDLKSLLLDRPTPVNAAQDLSRDVDELQGLVETLQSYVGETSVTAFQGVHQPWLELDNMSISFQRILDQTKELVEASERSLEDDTVNAMAMRAEARRLRTKLSVAIGVVAFCSCSDARDPHVQELQHLYERLRSVQEEVEDQRALNLPMADPLTIARLERLSTRNSLIMRKFMAHSLTSNRATLRESSVRVSSLIFAEDLAHTDIVASSAQGRPKTEPSGKPRERLPQVKYLRVLYDYDDNDDNPYTLTLRRGDLILVIDILESGWGDGISKNVRGWFPSDYCAPIDEYEDPNVEHNDKFEGSDSEDESSFPARLPIPVEWRGAQVEHNSGEADEWIF